MRCWICNAAEATESHHVYPTHLGGPSDGHQVDICGNCHSFVHRAAMKIANTGDDSEPLDGSLRLWYDRYERGRKAVAVIVSAMHHAENSDLGDSLVPITFKIPRSLRNKLHIKKQDSGSGSLTNYIIRLMVKDLGGNAKDMENILNTIKKG